MRYVMPPVNSAEYQRYHRAVRHTYGQPWDYYCVRECGRLARDWAWIHGTNPANPDNYMTLCRWCHQEYDRAEWLIEERRRERARIENTNAFKGWTPERREEQRQRMLARWNEPGRREAQAIRCKQDEPWSGRRPKNGGGAR